MGFLAPDAIPTFFELLSAAKKFCEAEHEKEVDLRFALGKSLFLQSHYAELLSDYDGGERRKFGTVEDWMARLREVGDIPPKVVQ